MRDYTYSLTKNIHDTEDLLQDLYCRAIRYIHKAPEETRDLTSWLNVMVRNLYINSYRRNKRYPMVQLPEYYLPPAPTNLYNKLMLEDVLKELKNVNTQYKECLLLYADGYTYVEIAAIQKIKEGTVKSQIHYARKHLLAVFHSSAIR